MKDRLQNRHDRLRDRFNNREHLRYDPAVWQAKKLVAYPSRVTAPNGAVTVFSPVFHGRVTPDNTGPWVASSELDQVAYPGPFVTGTGFTSKGKYLVRTGMPFAYRRKMEKRARQVARKQSRDELGRWMEVQRDG